MKQLFNAALAASVLATVLATVSASAQAANLSFTGKLAGDNDVQLFRFALAADSNVTLRTFSYDGGVNAAGSTIGAGGFDPVIALFAGTGNSAVLIDGDDDGGPDLDALLLRQLLAGSYTVALSQVANFANGPTLGDGFLGSGNPGFDGRGNAWALDILGVSSATVIPEPTTLALALLGLVAVAGLGRSRSRLRLRLRLRLRG